MLRGSHRPGPVGPRLRSATAVAAVLFTILAAATICYVTVRTALLQQVDSALRAEQSAIQRGDFRASDQPPASIPTAAGGPAPYVEISTQDGHILRESGARRLPPPSRLPGAGHATLRNATVSGTDLRVLTFVLTGSILARGVQRSVVVQLARPLSHVDSRLTATWLSLALAGLVGIAVIAWPLPSDQPTKR